MPAGDHDRVKRKQSMPGRPVSKGRRRGRAPKVHGSNIRVSGIAFLYLCLSRNYKCSEVLHLVDPMKDEMDELLAE